MQIGFPTDVKHVAHIGWDGPSVTSPSWMNEFKTPTGFSSAPLALTGGDIKPDSSVQWVSQDSARRGSDVTNSPCPAGEVAEVPKSTRRHSSTSAAESPTKEKTEKTKARKSSKSKDSSDSTRPSRRLSDLNQDIDSPTRNLPIIPKKTRRKKSKDSSVEGSTRSRSKAVSVATDTFSDTGSEHGSTVSMSKNDDFLSEGGGVLA